MPATRVSTIWKVLFRSWQDCTGITQTTQISVAGDCLDALLQWQHFVIARQDRDGAKFEALRQMHRADPPRYRFA